MNSLYIIPELNEKQNVCGGGGAAEGHAWHSGRIHIKMI